MEYNWLQIDAIIVNMMSAHIDKDSLYADLKKKFNWTDRQVEVAADPLLHRYSWHDKIAYRQITEKAIKKPRAIKKSKKIS
jgi:hypothetical protein